MRRGHGEVIEVQPSEPPDVVDPACDVGHSVCLGGRDHGVHLVAEREEGVYLGV